MQIMTENRTMAAFALFKVPFRSLDAFKEAPVRGLVLAALWMAPWYAVWLWQREVYGDHGLPALVPVFAGFAPLLLWSVFDYRLGLLFSIIATPLLIAPPIPHGFTQGFGDLFVIASVLGFALRNVFSMSIFRLWRAPYIWLAFILAAAIVSLALSPVWGQEVSYGGRYGLAEIAGLCLVISYIVLLVHEIRDRQDFVSVLRALMVAVFIVFLFGLVALNLSRECIGGYSGITPITIVQAISSTFGNTNYLGSYLVMSLPVVMLAFLLSGRGSAGRYAWGGLFIALVFMTQATLSRSSIIGLVVAWLGWLAITRWRPGTRLISIVVGLMLPMTAILWWVPGCICIDVPANYCPIQSSDNQESHSLHKAMPPKLQVGYSVRLQLLENAYDIWRDNPITGVGPGLMQNYSWAEGRQSRAHNVVMTTLAEQGIVGTVAWGGWWIALAMTFWWHRRRLPVIHSGLAFLAVSFLSMSVFALFMDFYRMLWVWQLGALMLAWPPVFGGEVAENSLERRPAPEPGSG